MQAIEINLRLPLIAWEDLKRGSPGCRGVGGKVGCRYVSYAHDVNIITLTEGGGGGMYSQDTIHVRLNLRGMWTEDDVDGSCLNDLRIQKVGRRELCAALITVKCTGPVGTGHMVVQLGALWNHNDPYDNYVHL